MMKNEIKTGKLNQFFEKENELYFRLNKFYQKEMFDKTLIGKKKIKIIFLFILT
jgi:hypothetical protein